MGKLQFDRSLFDPFWSEYHTKVTTTDNHQYSRDSKSVLPAIQSHFKIATIDLANEIAKKCRFCQIYWIFYPFFEFWIKWPKVGNTETPSTLFVKVQLVVWVKISLKI